MNLRRGGLEADLAVWESGEAELIIKGVEGGVVQEHFEDLNDDDALSEVLRRTLHAVSLT